MLLLGWGSMAGAQSVGISSPSHGELLLNTSAFYRGAPDYDIEVRGAAAIPKGTLNHVTTPMFSRMDIDDPLGEQQFVTYGLYPSQDDYWAAQFDQLQLYATYGPGVGGLEPRTNRTACRVRGVIATWRSRRTTGSIATP